MPKEKTSKRRYLIKCAVEVCKNQRYTCLSEKIENSLIKFHNFPPQKER